MLQTGVSEEESSTSDLEIHQNFKISVELWVSHLWDFQFRWSVVSVLNLVLRLTLAAL